MREMSVNLRMMRGVQNPNLDQKNPIKRILKGLQDPHLDQSLNISGCVPNTGHDVKNVKDAIKKTLGISTSWLVSAWSTRCARSSATEKKE